MFTRSRLVPLATVALLVALAGCGSSSSSKTPPAATPASTSTSSSPTASGGTSVAADPSGQLKFTTTSLSAKAGKVTINFTNSSAVSHNLTIQQGTSGKVLGATPTFQGGSKALTLKLKPGTYTFYCSVPGHRQGGMQGTLTVS